MKDTQKMTGRNRKDMRLIWIHDGFYRQLIALRVLLEAIKQEERENERRKKRA